MRFGILGAADIAKRRFLPALNKCNDAALAMIGVSSEARITAGQELVDTFGGQLVVGYQNVLDSSDIDAVYIPLPPSLHYEWAKKALLAGKHVFVEKPLTISERHTLELIELAKEKGLALTENYGFIRHPQMALIHKLIDDGAIGEVRNIRTAFGFPLRPIDDIRHQKSLGGGALLDAGGYTIRAGLEFLGSDSELTTASLCNLDGFEVDMYGSLSMTNNSGVTMQASFGMDNYYKCELEIWGQKGMLRAGRLYTAPDSLSPAIIVTTNDGEVAYEADKADQFLLQLEHFLACISDKQKRLAEYYAIARQIRLLDKAINTGRN